MSRSQGIVSHSPAPSIQATIQMPLLRLLIPEVSSLCLIFPEVPGAGTHISFTKGWWSGAHHAQHHWGHTIASSTLPSFNGIQYNASASSSSTSLLSLGNTRNMTGTWYHSFYMSVHPTRAFCKYIYIEHTQTSSCKLYSKRQFVEYHLVS